MQDRDAREYVKQPDLNAGDKIQVDDDFDCMNGWSVKEVKDDENGLYLICSCGRHYIDGHGEFDDDTLIGIYKLPT